MRFGQNHHQQQLLYQYRCSRCGTVLKETKDPIDRSIFRSINNERCANCGNVLQEQTVIVVVQHSLLRPLQNNISPPPHPDHALSSPLPMIFETAYDIQHRSTKLAFDIAEIDSLLDLPDRGGSICVASGRKSMDGGRHVNTLLTRLCIRALMSRRHGGFGSPSVIFIDAGNCSDIYQCVNFARQYGLDIQKVMDSIMVSRPFTIYQLAGLLLYELESAAIHRFGAKLIVVSDMLKMFSQEASDPQLDHDEAQWLLKEIAMSLQRISAQVLVAISLSSSSSSNNNRSSKYWSLLPHCDNQIDITATASTDGSHNLHLEITNHRHHDSKRHCLSLPEREVQLVLAR
jgi:DNA-directed RNA polymerase subunit RPC12/RpoP